MSSSASESELPPASALPGGRTFRLPRIAYLVVLLLVFCVMPLALTDRAYESAPTAIGPQTLLLLLPVIAAVFIARTATIVSTEGITVRLAFGSRTLPWGEVRGLSVGERSVYVVGPDGSVRLPCVRVADLAAVTRASGGHLPEVDEPTPKHPPARRRR